MTDATAIQRQAHAEIRQLLHDAVWSACVECDGETGIAPSAIVDEVLATLQRREIARALAYLAGVRMAPEISDAARRDFPGEDALP